MYGKLKAKLLARRAAASLAAGDTKSALLQARKVLDIDRNNLPATRTVVKSLDAVGALVAVQWHRRLEELAPGDAENLIAWARDALKAGDRAAADTALNKVRLADRNSAAYHTAAAGLAMANGDAAAQESHLAEAVRLDPAQNENKFNLAWLRLKSTKPEMHDQAVQALEELRARPKMKLPALQLLLEDAVSRDQPFRVLELRKALDSLRANPSATLEDRLALLSAQQAFKGPGFFINLEKFQASEVDDPNDLAELISWMNDHQLAIAACQWVSTLPAELTSKPPVNRAVAMAYYLGADWTKLKQSLESSPPDHLDFLRLALQSRLLKHQGNEGRARDAWNQALEAAKTRHGWLEGLARLAIALGWQQEREETLWALTKTPACPSWALDELWKEVIKTNDTAQMFRVAKLLFQAAPNELSVRTNFIYFALLTRNMQENPHELAELLYKENPGNAAIVRIYGLSLYLQGRNNKAVQAMAALPAGELQQPEVAFYYGVCLAVNGGESDKAREYLQRSQGLSLLPEEKAILANAREALRAATKTQETNAAAKGF
jgi:hypothetical protein